MKLILPKSEQHPTNKVTYKSNLEDIIKSVSDSIPESSAIKVSIIIIFNQLDTDAPKLLSLFNELNPGKTQLAGVEFDIDLREILANLHVESIELYFKSLKVYDSLDITIGYKVYSKSGNIPVNFYFELDIVQNEWILTHDTQSHLTFKS